MNDLEETFEPIPDIGVYPESQKEFDKLNQKSMMAHLRKTSKEFAKYINDKTYNSYCAEIKELESLLQEIPRGHVIERMGFEARLNTAKKVKEDLDKKK